MAKTIKTKIFIKPKRLAKNQIVFLNKQIHEAKSKINNSPLEDGEKKSLEEFISDCDKRRIKLSKKYDIRLNSNEK